MRNLGQTTVKLALLCLAALAGTVTLAASVPLPAPPGTAICSAAGGSLELMNDALRYRLGVRAQSVGRDELENLWTGSTQSLDGALLRLTLADRSVIDSDTLQVIGKPTCEPSPISAEAARAADRLHGADLHVVLASTDGSLRIDYRARLRDGTGYIRELYEIKSSTDLAVTKVQLLDIHANQASVAGMASGSPILAADRYFGFEHPMSEAIVVGGRASALVRRVLPLRAEVPLQVSTVIGVTGLESPRRGFQAYLESERAHPFRTFLHYNSWYDIGYFTPYTENEALAVVKRYSDELVQRRGVKLDSFLFDDGWDDHHRLWQFHDGFPQGFANLRDATQAIGAGPGIWLSPWGGYGPPRQERLATAKSAGYEVDDQGLALSGPRYYPLFHDTVIDLVKRYGVNQFKLDGTGSPDKVTPGSAFDSDFAAALDLIHDLRVASPSLYINLTTGTWPSPFWLASADSIWRGGEDHAFLGSGTDRQRWITYRDADTYGGIVRQGPLFPLNSLMLHGVIYAKHARGLNVDPGHDLADEVWSYFASGTGLQELYISPDLPSAQEWDALAEAARWARDRAEVLRDAHWIGGDPARGEVYGWASWSPSAAVIALRNPSNHPQHYSLDVASALELPKAAAHHFRITRRHGPSLEGVAPLSGIRTVELPAHAVVVWDLMPLH